MIHTIKFSVNTKITENSKIFCLESGPRWYYIETRAPRSQANGSLWAFPLRKMSMGASKPASNLFLSGTSGTLNA